MRAFVAIIAALLTACFDPPASPANGGCSAETDRCPPGQTCDLVHRRCIAEGEPPLPIVSDVAIGDDHVCAVREGALYCWGNNASGALGLATDGGQRPTPQPVAPLATSVNHATAGLLTTCAVQMSQPSCWGQNDHGQLGTGTYDGEDSPRRVQALESVSLLVLGERHICALVSGGLLCWGRNNAGAVGDGTQTVMGRTLPTPVISLSADVTHAAAGENHTCAVQAGQVLCWGNNNSGQLGDGTRSPRLEPTPVLTMSSGSATVAAGQFHTCAIQDAAARCWGDNGFGQLGIGETGGNITAPDDVIGLDDTQQITAGEFHTCAISDGALACWGDNEVGQLGIGSTGGECNTPTAVQGMDTGVTWVAAGGSSTCAIKQGDLFCWGGNSSGQLGQGDANLRNAPAMVTAWPD